MRNSFQKFVFNMPGILEKIIAAILLIAVIYGGFGLVMDSMDFAVTDYSVYLESVLKDAFSVIIVIEFVRMLVKHSMNTIVEVLIFAIARGLVVGHDDSINILFRIIAISILLLCRKFLTKEHEQC